VVLNQPFDPWMAPVEKLEISNNSGTGIEFNCVTADQISQASVEAKQNTCCHLRTTKIALFAEVQK